MDPLRLYVLAAALWLGWWSLAWGHDIYTKEPFEPRCCNDRDCRALEPSEIETVPGGFNVLGRFIPFGDAEQVRRRSPDGRFHACFHMTYRSDGGLVPSDRLRFIAGLPCLWAPEAGI